MCGVSFCIAEETDQDNMNIIGLAQLSHSTSSFYRGRQLSDVSESVAGIDLSLLGISAGIKGTHLSNNEDVFGYHLTYSYNFNLFILSAGIQREDPIEESTELFAEVTIKPIKKIETKISFFNRTDARHSKHIELKLARPIIIQKESWIAKPYTIISAGDYHATGFSFTHLGIGSDITYRLNKNIFLSLFSEIAVPLDNVKKANFNSTAKLNLGVTARYSF